MRRIGKALIILMTVLYLGAVLVVPNLWLLSKTFAPGWEAFQMAILTEHALAALSNTAIIVAVSILITVPLGVLSALILVRDRRGFRAILDGFIDLPFAAPAAISAFALIVTYGPKGILGGLLAPLGIKIIFAMPGMILATVFVTLPFVIREVAPLLEEIGTEAEEAARTLGASPLQTLILITIPGVRNGIIYGASLSYARALGEFGAVLIISGNILGRTQTMPTYIYDSYINFRMSSAYACATVLLFLALGGIGLLEAWRRRLDA